MDPVPGTHTFLCAWIDDCFLAVHSEQDPKEDEWNLGVKTLAKKITPRSRVFVDSKGGSPNAAQREAFNAICRPHAPLIVIITHSKIVRAAATAVRWFNPRVSILLPNETKEALAFLNLPVKTGEELMRTRAAFAARLTKPIMAVP